MGKILVTGALGNVGKYVCKYLALSGADFAMADIDVDKMKSLGYTDDIRCFNFTDSKTYSYALEGIDRLFIIRPPHIGNPKDMKPFIESLDSNKVKLVSFLSLIGIENNPVPPHYKIEKYRELNSE